MFNSSSFEKSYSAASDDSGDKWLPMRSVDMDTSTSTLSLDSRYWIGAGSPPHLENYPLKTKSSRGLPGGGSFSGTSSSSGNKSDSSSSSSSSSSTSSTTSSRGSGRGYSKSGSGSTTTSYHHSAGSLSGFASSSSSSSFSSSSFSSYSGSSGSSTSSARGSGRSSSHYGNSGGYSQNHWQKHRRRGRDEQEVSHSSQSKASWLSDLSALTPPTLIMNGSTPVNEALKQMILTRSTILYVAKDGMREMEEPLDESSSTTFSNCPLSLARLVRLFNLCPHAPIHECFKDFSPSERFDPDSVSW